MHKKILYIVISFAIFFIIGASLVYYIGIGPHHSLVNIISFITSADDNGYPLKESHIVDGTKNISVNDQGLRVSDSTKRKNLMILAGGSNIFGWGVTEEHSIFNLLERFDLNNEHSFVSYAYPGWGPHNLLARFETLKDIKIEAFEKNYFLYLMLDIHFERVCGSPYYYIWSSGASPRYKLVENKLVNTGLYLKTIDFQLLMLRSGIYKMLDSLGIDQYPYKTDMEIVNNESCQKLVEEVLKELVLKFKKRSPSGRFIVLHYFYIPNNELIESYKTELGVEFVSLREISHIKDGELKYFQKDGHFSAEANKEIARSIWGYIINEDVNEVK